MLNNKKKKKEKTKIIGLRFEQDIYKMILERAKREKISVSEMIRNYVLFFFAVDFIKMKFNENETDKDKALKKGINVVEKILKNCKIITSEVKYNIDLMNDIKEIQKAKDKIKKAS